MLGRLSLAFMSFLLPLLLVCRTFAFLSISPLRLSQKSATCTCRRCSTDQEDAGIYYYADLSFEKGTLRLLAAKALQEPMLVHQRVMCTVNNTKGKGNAPYR